MHTSRSDAKSIVDENLACIVTVKTTHIPLS